MSEAARASWRDALTLGEAHGYRNAQVSVIAPTGTIGLVMDCDTTGIEPDFALVKFKKLAGGGYFKIINRAVPEALRALGYDEKQITDIIAYAVGPRDARACAGRQPCRAQGQGSAARGDRQGRGGARRRFRHPLRPQQMDARRRDALEQALKITPERYDAPGFDLLTALGFSKAEIEAANCLRLRRDDARRRALSQA